MLLSRKIVKYTHCRELWENLEQHSLKYFAAEFFVFFCIRCHGCMEIETPYCPQVTFMQINVRYSAEFEPLLIFIYSSASLAGLRKYKKSDLWSGVTRGKPAPGLAGQKTGRYSHGSYLQVLGLNPELWTSLTLSTNNQKNSEVKAQSCRFAGTGRHRKKSKLQPVTCSNPWETGTWTCQYSHRYTYRYRVRIRSCEDL